MRAPDEPVLAIGFFDGVHLGHRRLLEGADLAITFDTHPLSVIAPDRAPVLLMTLEERRAALRESGVPSVHVIPFDRAFADCPAEAFVQVLCDRAGGCRPHIRCGENWRFGKGGSGDADLLRALGLSVEVVPYAEWKGERVSSSRIRACLAEGLVRDANAMLSRPYAVSGVLVPGKGLGRQMGFPTLNLDPCRKLNLRLGVYVVEMGGVRGVANYGHAPTLGEKAWVNPLIEVHLFGENPIGEGPVQFLDFLRPERTFASVADLQRQIADDCERARSAKERI